MSKNAAIEIFLRVRPVKKPSPFFKLQKDDAKAEFRIPKDEGRGYVNNTQEKHSFEFNKVFGPETTQQEIFDKISKEVVDFALDGYNGTIFAYGQTGSGKTFTMTGGAEHYNDRGIIPRTISYIFDKQKSRTDLQINVSISYIEIYNNDGYDLLDENHTSKNLSDLPKLIPRETQNEEIILTNLSIHKAQTEEDALNLLFIGDTNRVVSETPKNDASTRSHCIFMIMIEGRKPNSDVKTVSRIHLVDLSGSERIGKTGVEGLLQKEARQINLSLHHLEHVIVCLNKRANGENIHIPYRNSLMTLVLRDSLGGNCKTRMVATMNPEEGDLDESISTCRFAGRVALIKNQVTRNEAVDPSVIIERLKRENQQLKAELAMLKGSEQKDSLQPYEIDEARKKVQEFLENPDPSSTLILTDRLMLNECFYYFRHIIKDYEKNSKNGGPKQQQQVAQQQMVQSQIVDNSEEVKRLKMLVSQRDNEIMILLSLVEKYKKSGQEPQPLVVQPANVNKSEIIPMQQSKLVVFPETKIETTNNTLMQGGLDGPVKRVVQQQDVKKQHLDESLKSNTTKDTVPKEVVEVNSFLFQPLNISSEQLQDRGVAFEMFRKSYRKNQAMEENKEDLRVKFERGKELGQLVNSSRAEINKLKTQIEEIRKERALLGLAQQDETGMQAPDPREERLTLQIEKCKQTYKSSFDELKELKFEIERIQKVLEKSREKMQTDFEKWLDVMLNQRSMVLTTQNLSQDMSKIAQSKVPKLKDKDMERKLQEFYKNKEIIDQL